MRSTPARVSPPTLARNHLLRALAISALCLANLAHGPALAGNATLTPGQRYQMALEAQSARDYGAMLSHLRQAATEGDAEAQEALAMVLLVGPTLYGRAVQVDRCEALHWMWQAAAAGSETARIQLTFLNRLRSAPEGKRVCDASAAKG